VDRETFLIMSHSSPKANSAEAAAKRAAAVEAVLAAGHAALVASSPANVRWLLCGRGRPVSTSSPESTYTVVLSPTGQWVLFPDNETSRVDQEERFDELGFECVAYPWFQAPEAVLGELLNGAAAAGDAEAEPVLAPLRRELVEAERERFRTAGADLAQAMSESVRLLSSSDTERDAAADLAFRAHARGFFPPVVLVAGAERQRIHRHPLPTGAELGPHALVAVTAERDGLHVSMTRLLSFGPAPGELEELVRATAEVDAAMLRASRPGRTTGEVLEVAARVYEALGFPEEWRRHHQGGITGYQGREVFAAPGEPTQLPDSCAVAWNPSITGGAKSEDTALVTADGIEVVTRTTDLAESDIDGLRRPGITEL
jgi:Xaa-Pro aminopeptidase